MVDDLLLGVARLVGLDERLPEGLEGVGDVLLRREGEHGHADLDDELDDEDHRQHDQELREEEEHSVKSIERRKQDWVSQIQRHLTPSPQQRGVHVSIVW